MTSKGFVCCRLSGLAANVPKETSTQLKQLNGGQKFRIILQKLIMRLNKVFSILIIISFSLFFLASCQSETSSPPSSALSLDEIADTTTDLTISILPSGRPVYEEIRLETLIQDNCSGNSELENQTTRSRIIAHTLKLGSSLEVSADGKIEPFGVGVNIGTAVATEYGYEYGYSEEVAKSITVRALPGTKIEHTIKHIELWEVGNAKINIGEDSLLETYSFRSDFLLEYGGGTSLPCENLLFTPLPTSSPIPPTNTPIRPTEPEIDASSTDPLVFLGELPWRWEGTYNWYSGGRTVEWILVIEEVQGNSFIGQFRTPDFGNNIATIRAEFVQDISSIDFIEESRWDYVEGYETAENGIWFKFTELEKIQGTQSIVVGSWHYAHIQEGGNMKGVRFGPDDSEPRGDFLLVQIK